MATRKIAEGREHIERLMAGIDTVDRLVGSTLGPNGINSVLDKGFGAPIITNDGVSIASAIEVDGDIERMGVELMKDVAKKTNEMAGDGTTTSVVLSRAIAKEGLKYSENPMDIKRSLSVAGAKVVDELKKLARPIKTKAQINQIATISSESKEIGMIITDTIEAIGKDGVISVEESKLDSIQSKIVEGYEIEKGYVSPYMVNKDGNKAEYRNVKVLVVGDKLSTVSELLPFLQKISIGIKELVIFCTEIDPAVINTFIFNKQSGMFNTLAVRCASQNNEVLEDIAIVTGATFISKGAGFKLEELDDKVLGRAERIVATKDKTIILNGAGSARTKIKQLKASLSTISNDNEYDMVEKRIARLQGGIAVISVGAKTEPDMKYLYYKVEDAVNATKAAIEEGVVEGGGMALYRISQKLTGDTIGERILKSALKVPLRRIIENGGKDYTDIILNMPKGKGYNADTDIYEDLIKSGVIDPVKVERCCVENAVSFAGTFLTSRSSVAVVREVPKSDE